MADQNQVPDDSGVPSSAASLNPVPNSYPPIAREATVTAPVTTPGTPSPDMPTSVPTVTTAAAPPTFDLSKMSNDDILGAGTTGVTGGGVDLAKQSNADILGDEPSAWSSFSHAIPYFLGGGNVSGDVARDQFFRGTSAGRVLDAFGQGFSNAWGSEPVGMSEETRKWLRDAKIITTDEDSAWSRPFKAFNESFLRVGATAWDLASRTPGAVIASGASGAGQSAQELGASQTFGDELERNLNLLPFAMGDVAINTPHPPETVAARAAQSEGVAPSAVVAAVHEPTPMESAAIKTDVATQADTPQVPVQEPNPQNAPVRESPAPPTVDQLAAQQNPGVIDQWQSLKKRQDSYRQWIGDLNTQREAQAQANSPFVDQIAQTHSQISDLHARMDDATPRLAKKYSARIDDLNTQAADLQRQHDDYVSDVMSQDSPDVARVRQALMQNDYKMRDLAVPVSEAYRVAREQVATREEAAQKGEQPPAAPEPVTTPEGAIQSLPADDLGNFSSLVMDGRRTENGDYLLSLSPEEVQKLRGYGAQIEGESGTVILKANSGDQILAQRDDANTSGASIPPEEAAKIEQTVPNTNEEPAVAGAAEEPPAVQAPTPIDVTGQHFQAISDDVAQKLKAAGRSEEEANTVAPIIAAHYETRASRFDDRSALDMYQQEGPDVLTGRATTKNGTAKLVEGQRPIIRLMQSADASTFMHETGHVWLSELMQDAKTDGVHPSVVEDAGAVREWLGNTGEDITRRQHEKFARAMEDYMYTGHAPSARLANVFSQVREWLMSIYQAAKRTPMDIPENIRDIFDRLIERNPERQPLSEREGITKELADLHEVDAEHAPAAMSSEVGHNVEEDMQRATTDLNPLKEDVHEGTGGRLEPGAEDTATTNRPRLETGNDGLPLESATASSVEERQRAGEAEAEGGGSREEPNSAGGERNAEPATALGKSATKLEPPVGPHDSFGPSPKPERLFDKAGNIRLENLSRPEDIKDVLRTVALENQGFMEERGGVIPLVAQQEAADALGLSPETFVPNRPPDVSESQWLRAVKDLTLRSATSVRDLMVQTKNSRSDADAAALAKALSLHRMIQGEFSRAKAESGRALAANRWDDAKALVDGVASMAEQATGMTLNQLKKFAADGSPLDTPAKISKYIEDAYKPGAFDKLRYVMLNGLISGPVTHMTYLAANMLNAVFKIGVETPIAAALGTVRELTGMDKGGRVEWAEVPASAYGMFRGSRDGVKAAIQAWREGMTTPLPGEDVNGFYWKHYHPNPVGGKLGYAIGVPGRVVGALDAFSRNVFYSMNIAEQATRAAIQEGLTGDARARRVADLTSSPTSEMMDGARDFATSLAYMKKPEFGSAMYHIEHFANSSILTKMMLPFVRTGANIIDMSYVQRSPIGILSEQVRNDLLSKDSVIADTARSKMIAGTAIAAALTGLALDDMATGAGPDDPNKRALWMRDHRPYSVRIGGSWVAYKRFGHLGLLMGMGANLAESVHAYTDEGADAAVLQMAHGIASGVVDESWMAGLQHVLTLVDDPKRAGSVPFSFASELIPFSSLLRQSANALDPYLRKPDGMAERFQNMIPGWREDLAPRRDVWGEAVPSNQSPLYALAAAPFQNQTQRDPIDDELMRLGVYPTAPEKKMNGVELTAQQYDDYSRMSGRLKRSMVANVLNSPGWAMLPEQVKVEALHRSFEGANRSAKGALLMQYPAIIQQAQQLKLNGGK